MRALVARAQAGWLGRLRCRLQHWLGRGDDGGGPRSRADALQVLARAGGLLLVRRALAPGWPLQFAGRSAVLLTGHAAETLCALPWARVAHGEDWPRAEALIAQAVAEEAVYCVEYRIVGSDGAVRWVRERGVGCRPRGGPPCIEAYIEDIGEQVQTHTRIAEVELRFRSIFDNSVLGMYQTSEDGHYLAANQALADIYGYATPEALIVGLSDIAARLYVERGRRDQFKALVDSRRRVVDFESEVYRRDGERIWISENAHAVHAPDGRFLYYEGTVEDISERRRHHDQLRHQATHDPVTGLPNRYLLQERLDGAMAAARRPGGRLLVVFIDLDNFKFVNDSMGHAVGDRLLVEVACRLQASVRETDTLARYGGDEFVLICECPPTPGEATAVLERVQALVRQPVALDGHELRVSCSMGVAVYPRDGRDLETLLRHADAAMYEAKASGRDHFRYYEAGLNVAAQERLALESALRRALDAGEIGVVYQPKVDRMARVRGCEALARWHSAEFGWVGPARFIALAEDTGLIVPLTEHVLRRACTEAAGWPVLEAGAPAVAVNLSARHFRRDRRLVGLVRDVLRDSGLQPARLQLELTESLLVGDVEETVGVLEQLKALGVTLAIDDFGTGYSSLAYLKRFPVDVLKIDRSFVAECDRGEDARAIPKAIISLGHSLGLSVVAEGVERAAQAEFLIAEGCDELQGYLYARPLPPAELRDFLGAGMAAAAGAAAYSES